jgi:hypothetical protein
MFDRTTTLSAPKRVAMQHCTDISNSATGPATHRNSPPTELAQDPFPNRAVIFTATAAHLCQGFTPRNGTDHTA